MSKWIKLDNEDNFKEEVKVYMIHDNPVAVFKLEDGFYAIDDTCSHARASLSIGEVFDGEVECPLHGAAFDIRTGKNLSMPAVVPVKSYPVKVENGDILIEIEEE
ncbi:MAG: non-heme iron oxygenase ferredoxin subunit [Calditrichia bacterium]